MKNLLLVSLTFSALTIVGCGPEKSQMDVERENSRERLSQKQSEYDTLAGHYRGEMTFKGQTLGTLDLYLTSSFDTVPNNTQDGLWIAVLSGYCIMSDPTGKSEAGVSLPDVQYDAGSKLLLMKARPDAKGTDLAKVNAHVLGDRIEGVYNPPRPTTMPDGTRAFQYQFAIKKVEN